tara:strand:- start:729 stop:1382 length:654 start_codon:yes stop_codon:yes gene_type:complete
MTKKTNFVFWLIVLVCITPVIASSIAYYVYRPEGRVNYGFLINKPIDASKALVKVEIQPEKESTFAGLLSKKQVDPSDNEISSLKDFKGRWLLVRIGSAMCDETCTKELYAMRQVRLMTGKNRSRVERIWLMSDNLSLNQPLNISDFEGTWGLRIQDTGGFLNRLENISKNVNDQLGYKGLWLIDPQGQFMMRFPSNPDIKKMYKDLARLLKVSRTG